MCLLDQTAYLVLLAVYVSCADRWLLCILCPCVNCLYISVCALNNILLIIVTKLIHLQCIARAQNCLTSMFVKGGQISERGAKFPRKYGPRGGGAIFPRKFGPGGPYFGGAKFPGTPVY